MQKVTTKAIAKVAAVAAGLAMATSMLSFAPMAQAAGLTSAQVQAILSLLTSFGASSSTIANVQTALNGGTPSSTTTTTSSSTSSSCSFTRDLTIGSTGSDVTCLQNALITGGYSIPAGATGYFGGETKAAVIKWQMAAGVKPAAGYFGPISRAAFNLGGSSSTTTTTTTGGTTTTTATGTGLKVALSATSPNGTVLVAGQGIGDLADFTFTNPTASPINVTNLSFKRIGVSNDTTLTNIYLYDGATRITDSAGISNSAFSFSDPTALFTVPAGGSYTVSVRSDIATGSSGQQIGVSLLSALGSVALDPSVVFPINSGLQTVSAANLATVSYGATVTPSATSISPQSDYPVWQNTVSVSTNPVNLTSMRFTNLGSIDASYLTNLRLYVDGVQVGSAVPSMNADRTVTFDLSSSPVSLSEQSHTIKVLANITGGADRTIQFSVQRSSDAMFVDSQLDQPVTPTDNNGGNFSAQTAGLITMNSVSASSGVSVSLDSATLPNPVAVGATNVEFGRFDMLASGENVKVSDLYVYSTDSIHGDGGLKNGKIEVNGVQVGSTKDIGYSSGTETDFSLGSSLILPAGQTTAVSVFADAKTSTSTNLSNGETVAVTLDAGSSNAQGQSSLNSVNVPATPTIANQITVSSSALTATKYTGYGNQTVIPGANNVKLGAFTLSAGSTEGITVNTIVVDIAGDSYASITNLTLKDDATGNTLGTVQTTPSASNSFAVNFDIPASSTKTIDIYGNVLSGTPAGTIVTTVDDTTSGTGDTTGSSASPVANVALQTITVGNGSLTVTTGPNDPVSNNIIAGAASANVGQFEFSAENSSYTVRNLAILVPNNAATSVTNVTVSYTDASGATQTATQPLVTSPTSSTATATFTGLTMYVPAGDQSDLNVSVGTPTISSGATSGAAINVTLATGAVANTFQALNSSGTATTTINSGANVSSGGTFYVRESVPTIAVDTTDYGGTALKNPLYAFTVSADPAGPIEWTRLVFNVATSTTDLTGVYLTDSNGNNLLDNTTSSASTTNSTITVDLTKNSTQPKYQQVGAGSSKTYYLYGNAAPFGTGDSVTISLAQDTGAPAANAAAASVSGNFVWSDRSATNHSITTSDWTDGAFIKNFTNTSVSYSK